MTLAMAEAMKTGMRRLATSVSVLSTRDDEREYAMTVSSVTSLSDNPPSLLVCVNTATEISKALSLGQGFTINVLGQHHQDVSIVCSRRDRADVRFDTGEWWRSENEPPFLLDAHAIFQCSVDSLHRYGTHNVVIGRIEDVLIPKAESNPLLYFNGLYRELA